jgi:hypothetical protein
VYHPKSPEKWVKNGGYNTLQMKKITFLAKFAYSEKNLFLAKKICVQSKKFVFKQKNLFLALLPPTTNQLPQKQKNSLSYKQKPTNPYF